MATRTDNFVALYIAEYATDLSRIHVGWRIKRSSISIVLKSNKYSFIENFTMIRGQNSTSISKIRRLIKKYVTINFLRRVVYNRILLRQNITIVKCNVICRENIRKFYRDRYNTGSRHLRGKGAPSRRRPVGQVTIYTPQTQQKLCPNEKC